MDKSNGQGVSLSRRRRKVLRIVLSVLAVVIILVILGPTLIPENKVRQILIDRLAGQTQSAVKVEHVHFGWWAGWI
ncbi:MAG: hypothetical protein WC975_10860 [Phycisphaerae bacterium]